MRDLVVLLSGILFIVGCQSDARQADTYAADSNQSDYSYRQDSSTRLISDRRGDEVIHYNSSDALVEQNAYPPEGSIYSRDTDWQHKPVSLRSPADVPAPDEFMRDAASTGKMQVELGRIALTRAENPRVRQFGQKMITDHNRANEDLMRIARDENISIPAQPTADHSAMIDRMSELSGASFDKQYMQMMVDDHATDVQEYEAQANNGQDEGVRDFAERTVKVLREHLRLAREIEHELDVGVPDPMIRANPTRPLP